MAKDGNLFGKSSVFLEGRRNFVRTEETNLGNVTADASLWMARKLDPAVAISIKNGGGVRSAMGEVYAVGSQVTLLPTSPNALANKQRGDISQSSFAFTVDTAQWSESDKYGDMGLRTIVKIKELYDVSPVTYPAYASTSISARDEESLKAERERMAAEQNNNAERISRSNAAKIEAVKTLIKSI